LNIRFGSLRVFAIGANVHIGAIRVVVFLLQLRPAFFADERVGVCCFFVFLEESLAGRRLTLVVADVPADVLGLVKGIHVFLHTLLAGTHDADSALSLVSVIEGVSVCNVLAVDTAASLDHWQLLRVNELV